MFTFTFLNKQEKAFWLPQLFELLYENMQSIAPSGLSYDAEKQQFLDNVSPALEKDPRKIILCFYDGELIGYAQYYTRDNMLMVEEVQLKKAYRRSFAFYRLCKYLLSALPPEIRYVEAYADRRNAYSQRIMFKLGMEILEEEGRFFRLRGQLQSVKETLHLH